MRAPITRESPTFTMATRNGHVAKCDLAILPSLWDSKAVCLHVKLVRFTLILTAIAQFLGTKGRHSNIKPEEPKPEPVQEVPEKVEETASTKVDEVVEAYTPPEENLMETIKVVESANLANAPPVKNIVICKNCKAEESTLEAQTECLYHRGVRVCV